MNADPNGLTDGPNLYIYVFNKPTTTKDISGNQGEPFNEAEIISQRRFPRPDLQKKTTDVPVQDLLPLPNPTVRTRKRVFIGSEENSPSQSPAFSRPARDTVVRKMKLSDMPKKRVMKEGFAPPNPKARISYAEHAFGKPGPYGSASELPSGSETGEGEPYWIDKKKAAKHGWDWVSHERVMEDYDRLIKERPDQADALRRQRDINKALEHEGMFEKNPHANRAKPTTRGLESRSIPPTAIETSAARSIKGLGKLFTGLAILDTVHRLAEAASRGSREFGRELGRQMGSWAVALGLAALVATIVTGGWGALLALVVTGVGGFLAHDAFDPLLWKQIL